MKIKKIQGSKAAVNDMDDRKEPVYGDEFSGMYAEAQNHIMDAIKELTEIARTGDKVAKDSIANLSVVLLDLQGNKK